MLLDIIIHPNPKLREKSHKIPASPAGGSREEILSPKFKKFIKDMGETMLKKDGVGLAAPQVGRAVRAIVVDINDKVMPFINPKIIRRSLRKSVMEEGCLSIPGVYGNVKRSTTIHLEYLDLEGKKQKIKASGLPARVIQHEIDHLDGILFIDKIVK